MKSIIFLSSSPRSSSPPSPQTPSPSSQQEPTTSPGDNSSSRGKNFKTSSKNEPTKLEYLDYPQDPSLFFRFLVYASGGTLPSTVKKVTREAPKRQNRIFDWAFSGQKTQYSWVVQPVCCKKHGRSKDSSEKEATQADTDDIAAHKEDAHKEVIPEKSVHENYSQKPITFDLPINPALKPTPKARSRVSAPLPSSSRPAGCTLMASKTSQPRCSSFS